MLLVLCKLLEFFFLVILQSTLEIQITSLNSKIAVYTQAHSLKSMQCLKIFISK